MSSDPGPGQFQFTPMAGAACLRLSGDWTLAHHGALAQHPTRRSIPAAELVPATDYRWTSVDGIEIQGWLYRTKLGAARGLIVQIHGGPTAHAEARISPLYRPAIDALAMVRETERRSVGQVS